MRRITIAIDGYSSCGKSTLARDLARLLGYTYVDSGAMYRAVARYAIDHGLWDGADFDLPALREAMSSIRITFSPTDGHTMLNGVDVESRIRTLEVSKPASAIAVYDFVREALVQQQQAMGLHGGIVMDGRDIGTVVFPHAELKIFLTASSEVRAERRYLELQAKGDTSTTREMVASDLADRDYRDSHREIAPLRRADDAVVIDNSTLTIDQQTQVAYQLALQTIAEK